MGEDKAQYIVIDTKEKLGNDAGGYGLDWSNLVSREDLWKQLEENGQGLGPGGYRLRH